MNPWILLAFVLTLGAVGGGAYWQGRQDGEAGCLAEQLRDEAVAAIASDAAASAAAHAISRIKVQHRTVQQEVQREISERVVYRDCSHSPEQLQRLNAALTGARPEPAGRGLVPRADAALGPVVRRDDAEADRGGRPVP